MTFCFKCSKCGFRVETQTRDPAPTCKRPDSLHAELVMQRDYRTEGVGIGEGVRTSNAPNIHEQAALFLPTNEELAGPGDPDGTKAMREYRDGIAPSDSNKKPFWPGEIEKKVF